ncbi:MAG: glycosyltransferase [Patescibacteria group bacterium UBA2163]
MTRQNTRALMLSTDAKILDADSAVQARMQSYGTLFEKLTILVLGVGERQVFELSSNVRVVFPGGASKKEAYSNAFLEGMREGRALAPHAPEKNTDNLVVSTQDPFFLGFAGWRIARALHVSLQTQIHTDAFNPHYFLSSIRKFIEVFIAFFVIAQATRVRVVSKRIAKSLWFVNKEKITVLPIHDTSIEDVEVASKRPTAYNPEHPVILMVSRLEPEKRIHVALEAMVHVPEAHLYIAGSGSRENLLKKRARNLGIASRVHFLGWQKDLASYYEHADIFLQLSRFEGYGMTLIDAGLARLPIVTTDVGVVGEVYEKQHDVLVVRPLPYVIARALSGLLADPNARVLMGGRARKKAHSVLMEKEAYKKAYQQAFTDCLNQQ